MASSDTGAYSSTSISSLGVSWALEGGSSGGEAEPRRLHVGEVDLNPLASPLWLKRFRAECCDVVDQVSERDISVEKISASCFAVLQLG